VDKRWNSGEKIRGEGGDGKGKYNGREWKGG
jgi:hypothetical protein